MSSPKHTVSILPVGAATAASDDGLYATYQVSCLCGWRAEQVYRQHARAARAFHRHLRAA